jgi:ankyrin repeat protein
MTRRIHLFCIIASLWCAGAVGAAVAAKPSAPQDALEPARAALRTLQFDKAAALLTALGNAGNPDAEYLLGLMYLNGVAVMPDPARGVTLIRSAAERGSAAAAYVLAGYLSRNPDATPGEAQRWLERSAKLGYTLALEALKSGRPLLASETLGATDPRLMTAWVIECVRKNNVGELRRLGHAAGAVQDPFGRSALSLAAGADSVDAAAVLIGLGADVQAVDRAGTTALMIAAEGGDSRLIDLLLSHGADPQKADNEGRTALFYAARGNRAMAILALQRAGAGLEAHDSRGYGILDAALVVGADEAATQLRALGLHAARVTVDPARQSAAFDPARPGDIYRGWPPLAIAVSRDDSASVQQQLAAGGNPNLRLPGGGPLVQIAADVHAFKSLSVLLARGADASATDRAGHSTLWLAAAHNDAALVKALLDARVSADTHAPGEQTPLLVALGAAHPAVAQMLLAAGADANAVDPQGRTPLMLACASGSTSLIANLLEHHGKIDAEDHEHRTAVLYAAAVGSRAAVTLLLNAGANPKAIDAQGATALHIVARQPGVDVLEPLLAIDLPLNRRDAQGDTPLLLAAATGNVEIVRTLLARSPDLNVQNGMGDTALIAASRGGYQQICHLLLAAGANKMLRNGAGISAGDVAAARGFTAITAELARG